MNDAPITPSAGFAETGLSPELLKVLAFNNLEIPTPIQAQSIPVGLQGGDLIGIAQTGTGKTLAFALPLIDRLKNTDEIALIIVPTRELALQVEESLRRFTQAFPGFRTISLIGGMPMFKQIQALKNRPRLIIGTPGRLNDHIERRTLRLNTLAAIVLDEADRMLDMGFAPQIEQIMKSVPVQRQTMMFSATMPPEVSRLVASYTKNPTRIEIAKAGTSANLVRQELCYVAPFRKGEVLSKLLDQHTGPTLVFTRTKAGARDLVYDMRATGHEAAEIHGDLTLRERRAALDGFKAGRHRILVATDVASRGIDVSDIALVINYDLPDDSGDYVHRIGRTGRAGKSGISISFATYSQSRAVKTIENLMGKEMIISEHSDPVRVERSGGWNGGQRSGGNRGGGGYGQRSGGGSRGGFAPRQQPRNTRGGW